MTSPDDVERQLVNWRDEIDSAAFYRMLADLEPDTRVAEVYRRLAATEERHAGFWEERLRTRFTQTWSSSR
jgi:rubrerythrin